MYVIIDVSHATCHVVHPYIVGMNCYTYQYHHFEECSQNSEVPTYGFCRTLPKMVKQHNYKYDTRKCFVLIMNDKTPPLSNKVYKFIGWLNIALRPISSFMAISGRMMIMMMR